MFCRHCGATIPDDSRFCPQCGTQVLTSTAGTPGANGTTGGAGWQQGYGQQQAGAGPATAPTRAAAAPQYQQGFGQQQASFGQAQAGYGQQQAGAAPQYQQGFGQRAAATGALLLDAGKMTRYNGKGPIGPVTGSGTLCIYDDRIEYKKTSGDQRGYMLGPIIGNLIAREGARKNPVDVYYFRDIASVEQGKYAGALATMVIHKKDGKAVSFVPGGRGFKTGDIVQKMCALVSQYL